MANRLLGTHYCKICGKPLKRYIDKEKLILNRSRTCITCKDKEVKKAQIKVYNRE